MWETEIHTSLTFFFLFLKSIESTGGVSIRRPLADLQVTNSEDTRKQYYFFCLKKVKSAKMLWTAITWLLSTFTFLCDQMKMFHEKKCPPWNRGGVTWKEQQTMDTKTKNEWKTKWIQDTMVSDNERLKGRYNRGNLPPYNNNIIINDNGNKENVWWLEI